MKTSTIFKSFAIVSLILIGFIFNSCKQETNVNSTLALNTEVTPVAIIKTEAQSLSEEFKKYWYAGEAEITSYDLVQAQYGQPRNGSSVMIFVTEDFLPNVQVKADRQNPDNVPVMKLNRTKNFVTGVYPYSIMQSTFFPVSNNKHAIKVSSSVQEWCGQQYSQLNNRNKFEIESHSYFERDADKNFTLDKAILENELWIKLRIDPKSLPVGDLEIIPSLEYIRLTHRPTKAYKATATLSNGSYKIEYPQLQRTLTINFDAAFPHVISGWEETSQRRGQTLTTKGTKKVTIKSPYWGKNSPKDEALRDVLQLK